MAIFRERIVYVLVAVTIDSARIGKQSEIVNLNKNQNKMKLKINERNTATADSRHSLFSNNKLKDEKRKGIRFLFSVTFDHISSTNHVKH